MPIKPNPAGIYTERVDLYGLPGETQDAYGQPVPSGAARLNTAPLPAQVENLKGQEILGEQQAYTLATHRVRMPWLGDAIRIRPDMYLILRTGARLDVVMADNEFFCDRQWRLICNERVHV
jgi:hypothetical protein